MLHGRKVWDAFLFSHELELLELRIRELEQVVDTFVVIESERTHSGLPKPLVFKQNQEKFAKWKNKIRHHVAPLPQTDNDGRENAHRREVGYALQALHVEGDDIVHTSDLDEIPAYDAFVKWHPDMGICGFETPHSYYWLNCEAGGWGACRIATWGQIAAEVGGDFQKLRHIGRDVHLLRAADSVPLSGGWHLSFMGGADVIQRKLTSYLHSPVGDECKMLDPRWIRFCISTGVSLFYAARDDQDHFFKFVTPRVLPLIVQAGHDFDWLLAKDVSFAYKITPRQLRLLWRAMCERKKADGAIIDVGSEDGMTALAMAAVSEPQMVLCQPELGYVGRTTINVARLAKNIKILIAPTQVSLARAPDISFCHVSSNCSRERFDDLAAAIVPGGTLCGTYDDDFVARLRGVKRQPGFWSWVKQ